MEKYIFDKCNGLWYELQGDYYIPCLMLNEPDTAPIGMWGRKHQQYLKEHHPMFIPTLFSAGNCTAIWLILIPRHETNSICS